MSGYEWKFHPDPSGLIRSTDASLTTFADTGSSAWVRELSGPEAIEATGKWEEM